MYLLDDTLPVIGCLEADFFLADLLARLVVVAALLALRSTRENVYIRADRLQQSPNRSL